MIEEKEILELVNNLKDDIIRLKVENKELKKNFKMAKELCDDFEKQNKEKENELEEQRKEIEGLKAQISCTEQQVQKYSEANQAARNAFMEELSRVIEDAKSALDEDS